MKILIADQEKFIALINRSEAWLMERVLHYAKQQDFTKYTSTLLEPWRLSIEGLSTAMLQTLDAFKKVPELCPDDDYIDDPGCQFGIKEAQLHRSRGVSLSMFLGLMKYYRQCYIELIRTNNGFADHESIFRFVERFFDRTEIAFCTEWAGLEPEHQIRELSQTNLLLANEKNKYLTLFESLSSPVFLLDRDGYVDNMNLIAALTFSDKENAGAHYYDEAREKQRLTWLDEELKQLGRHQDDYLRIEKRHETADGIRHFDIKIEKMLDVSHKFSGYTVLLDDITEKKRAETELQKAKDHLELEVKERTCELESSVKRLTDEIAAREKAEEMSNHFGELVNGSLNEIYTFDAETLNFITVNRGARRNLGYSKKELRKITPLDLKPEFTPERFEALIEPLKKREKEKIEYTTIHRRKDGSTYPVEIHLQLSKTGSTPTFVAFAIDISKKQHAELTLQESEEKFRSIATAARDAVIMVDSRGRVAYWNPASQLMFGYEAQEVIGKNLHLMFAPSRYHEQFLKGFAQFAENGNDALTGKTLELEAIRKDGSEFPIELSVSSLKMKGEWHAVGTIRDITVRKQAEESLRYRAEFEAVTSQLSSAFVCLGPKEIDTGIYQALQLIGEFAKADRSYLFLLGDDNKIVVNTHEWCASGIEAQIKNLKNLSLDEELPWFATRIRNLEDVNIPIIAHLPPEAELEKAHFQDQDIQSLVVVPMVSGSTLKGFIGFDSVRDQKNWSQDIISLLRISGENISKALERNQAEESLCNLNRALRVLSECNEALVHATNEPQLLEKICLITVETGAYPLVWVGYAEHDAQKSLRVVAQAGPEPDFLKDTELSWAEKEQGRLPAGMAVRTGETLVVQDILADSNCELCQQAAEKYGFGSCCAFPLMSQGQPIGVLSIYANGTQAFGTEELKLLQELSEDLAFGIQTLRAQEERRRVTTALKESEQRFRALYVHATDGILVTNLESKRFLTVNPAICQMLGYSEQELMGLSVTDLHRKEDLPFVLEQFKQEAHKDFGIANDIPFKRKDGSIFIADITGSSISIGGEKYSVGMIRDITERKQAEEERRKSDERLQEVLVQTIEAIALTVEKRDPYTAGHQQRVADLAVAIANELGLDEQRIHGIRLGGIIHDIGKIYIPAEILNRPGRLSSAELELIKSHPEVGHDIISTVKFPWPVREMVLQHHERMDGSGYPHGIKGSEITLEARILAVADVVEAMVSHRPYRPGLGLGPALKEIKRGRGTAYDEAVVDACLKVFNVNNYEWHEQWAS